MIRENMRTETSFNQSSVENGWSLLHYITNLGHTWMVGHILEKTDESEAYLWIEDENKKPFTL